MKKVIFTSIVLAGLAATEAEAKIWRVNNQGYGADFTQINDAINDPNVLAGDTLHIEGSSVVYDYATITKSMTIIGPGYFLSQNPKTSTNNLEAICRRIYLNEGAQGTIVYGLSFHENDSYGIDLNASNLTVKRCKFPNRINVGIGNSGNGISNIIVSQNFFSNNSSNDANSAINYNSSYNFPTNFYFVNNIVQRPLVIADNSNFVFLSIENNIFDLASVSTSTPSLRFYTASFKNNILVNNAASVKINGITNFSTTPNAAVSHNIGTSSVVHFGTANNNLVVNNISSIWNTATAASPDGKYQLATGSVASGSGNNGVDRGAFGGAAVSNRYTLSGLAPIPVIYEVSTTGVATPSTGLNVTIKARTIE